MLYISNISYISTIIHKIFEKSSSLHVKECSTGKVRFPFFQKIFISTDKVFISGGGMDTR